MSVSVPHFDLPFRYFNGSAAVVEQSSVEDVANCVFAVCATEPGQFNDAPEFGLPDLTFEQEPINRQRILGPISRWEPRAKVLAELNPTVLDSAIVNANLQIGV